VPSSPVTPTSLADALDALRRDPQLIPVAGCTDLMVTTALARARMTSVINLLAIPELKGIRSSNGSLEIGATTTFSEIRRSPDVRAALPILAEAAALVGGWQIQNRATIGGNIANASPAGDSLPVLLALDARIIVAGPNGQREVAYDDFHVGYRKTALDKGEIVVAIRIAAPTPQTAQRFRKVGTRQAQAISKIVVALTAQVENGRVTGARIAAGSVAPTPVRLRAAEQALVGHELTADLAARVALAARDSVTPIDDVRSTAAYRSLALERVVARMVRSIG
jgi:CO/xanthine dehydrogenase FAD-binding subunit